MNLKIVPISLLLIFIAPKVSIPSFEISITDLPSMNTVQTLRSEDNPFSNSMFLIVFITSFFVVMIGFTGETF